MFIGLSISVVAIPLDTGGHPDSNLLLSGGIVGIPFFFLLADGLSAMILAA